MLFLHELHTVAGRHEDAFEAAVRTGWMPALARDDDARLLYYLKLAHGTGRAYQVVTITGLRDGAAYERLATRVQRGDLRKWAADVDRLRHEVAGKVLLPLDWSPLQHVDLATVPVDGPGKEPALFMEDSAWPYEAKLDDYLEAARTHYAPSLEQQTARSLLTLVGVFQAALGAPRRREDRVVAAGRPSGAAPGTVHDRAARARQGTGHLDARRARSARRLGEPPPANSRLVAPELSRARPDFWSEATFSPRRFCRPCRRARGTRPRTRPSCIRSRARPTRAPSRCRSARASSRPAACTAPGSSLHRR